MRESDVVQTLLSARPCGGRSDISAQGVPLSEWRVDLPPSATFVLDIHSDEKRWPCTDRVLDSEIRYDFSISEPLSMKGGPRLTKFVSDRLTAQLLENTKNETTKIEQVAHR